VNQTVLTIEIAEAEGSSTSFGKSIDSLLALGLRAVEAEECTFYNYSALNSILSFQKRAPGRISTRRLKTARIQVPASTSVWLRALSAPEYIPSLAWADSKSASFPEVIENSLESVLVVPLVHGENLIGLLNFGWQSRTTLDENQIRTANEIGAAVSSVVIREREASLTIHLASRIHRLQAELADGKIADRARGILLEDAGRADSGGIMRQHVDRVLEGTDALVVLQQEVAKLEAEVESRRVINRAKQFLQRTHHLSEEEAYLRLRNFSRQSRRRLLDVAGDVLETAPAAGTTR